MMGVEEGWEAAGCVAVVVYTPLEAIDEADVEIAVGVEASG